MESTMKIKGIEFKIEATASYCRIFAVPAGFIVFDQYFDENGRPICTNSDRAAYFFEDELEKSSIAFHKKYIKNARMLQRGGRG